MGIKYEAVFGDQGLFDRNDAPEDCEIIGDCCYKVICGEVNVWNFSEKRWCDHYKSSFLCLAMRRIIRAPTWTVADQNAGKLPEVGSEVILRITGEIATVNAANKNMVCLTFSDGGFSPFNVERIDPIETPEEMAKREEDEFVSLVESEYNKMPNEISFKAGIRAAYRKLKGGE